MANWIAVDCTILGKPELGVICDATGESIEVAFCRIWRLWCWFTSVSGDGVMRASLGTVARNCTGDLAFWQAVVDAGWLVVDGDTLRLPGWEDRFSKTAKARIMAAERQGRFRRGGGGKALASARDDWAKRAADSVTQKRDASVTPPLRDRYLEREIPTESAVSQSHSCLNETGKRKPKPSARQPLRLQRADFGFEAMTDDEHVRAKRARALRCEGRARGFLADRQKRTGEPFAELDVQSLWAQYVEAEVVDCMRRNEAKKA